MSNETLNKILKNKTIWVEIKAKEQEYNRLCKQIEELQQAKKEILFSIQKQIEESQKISDWLLEREFEALSERGL